MSIGSNIGTYTTSPGIKVITNTTSGAAAAFAAPAPKPAATAVTTAKQAISGALSKAGMQIGYSNPTFVDTNNVSGYGAGATIDFNAMMAAAAHEQELNDPNYTNNLFNNIVSSLPPNAQAEDIAGGVAGAVAGLGYNGTNHAASKQDVFLFYVHFYDQLGARIGL
jgi:hypothetical protein